MTARIIDGKTIAADLRGKVTDAVHRLLRDRGIVPGLAVVLVGAQSRERGLRPQQVQGGGASRHARVRPQAAGERERSRIARSDRAAQCRPGGERHPGATAAAAADRRAKGHRRHRSGQGRRRIPSAQCRRLASGLPGLVPCTPLGLRDAGQDRACLARRPGGGGDRPLQHRRQAGGAIAAGGERHRDHRAFQDARFAGGVPPRRFAGRRDRQAGDGARRLDQAGRDRDRRRHQPGCRARAANRVIVGDVAYAEAAKVAGAIDAGAGRRRADDDRLPAAQYAARRLHAQNGLPAPQI